MKILQEFCIVFATIPYISEKFALNMKMTFVIDFPASSIIQSGTLELLVKTEVET